MARGDYMPEKLLRITSVEPQKAIYTEYEDGVLGANQVRAKVEYAAAKHGTEFTIFRGDSVHAEKDYDEDMQLFALRKDGWKYGISPGNMWVGRIIETGANVASLSVGMRIASYGGFRMTQTCEAEQALVMPESMSWKSAVCYDPLQFALGGVRDGNVRAGDRVAVFGLGAIGQMAVQLCKKAGALKVIACDPIAERRGVALENGADEAVDSGRDDAGYILKKLTNNRGADVILETSGHSLALQAAIRGLAYNGNIAVVGWYHECKGGLDFGQEAHFNQPNLLFSRACSEPNRDYPRWDFNRICAESWEMLVNGWFNCENIVQPVVCFNEAAATYMDIFKDPGSSIKLGVSYN
jgi:threonine dehydrogenase-like Zn-dependent dehydrogenase